MGPSPLLRGQIRVGDPCVSVRDVYLLEVSEMGWDRRCCWHICGTQQGKIEVLKKV